jgi:Zn-dependent M28 family amino/carboxypeptidase
MEKPKIITKLTPLIILIIVIILSACNSMLNSNEPIEFNGERAFEDLEYQVSLGPRVIGSDAHQKVREWIIETNEELGWQTENQSHFIDGQEVHNIISKQGENSDSPWIIIGAHYDSRSNADNDPNVENHNQPVLGANDGASGVAVLMELARVIPKNISGRIWLVYFDAEDYGNLPLFSDWAIGSRAFVNSLEGEPDAVVVVDMIGDADLNIFMERYSNRELNEEIWEIAASLGYEKQFIPQPKWNIIDDHLPFVRAGIPAIDIIDFDYPYWHTVEDTLDKVSPESLQIVGDVVLTWLVSRTSQNP